MKYVILKPKAGGLPFAVMGLGAGIIHEDLARLYPDAVPLSAARVRFSDTGEAEVFGESASLRMGPTEGDSRFLTAFYRAETSMAPSRVEQRERDKGCIPFPTYPVSSAQ